MRDGLAWRWIGLHAAAFARNIVINRLMYWLYGDPIAYHTSWSVTVLSAVALAGTLGLAQTAALWKQSFPVSPARWWVSTAVGVVIGRLAIEGLGWSYTTAILGFLQGSPEMIETA